MDGDVGDRPSEILGTLALFCCRQNDVNRSHIATFFYFRKQKTREMSRIRVISDISGYGMWFAPNFTRPHHKEIAMLTLVTFLMTAFFLGGSFFAADTFRMMSKQKRI